MSISGLWIGLWSAMVTVGCLLVLAMTVNLSGIGMPFVDRFMCVKLVVDVRCARMLVRLLVLILRSGTLVCSGLPSFECMATRLRFKVRVTGVVSAVLTVMVN